MNDNHETGRPIVIAVDGPAASGKGTLVRRLAKYLELAPLDTGALYRGVGLAVLKSGGTPEDEMDALAAALKIGKINLDDPELRNESTGAAASKVAVIPSVREALLKYQHDFMNNPPDGKEGSILDGRDIGTVICPTATAKIFIIADVEIRAKRRVLELYGTDHSTAEYNKILADLKMRDERDQNRSSAPLKAAEDAYLLDTTNSDIETVFEKALGFILNKL
jgi:cytidylate kinase